MSADGVPLVCGSLRNALLKGRLELGLIVDVGEWTVFQLHRKPLLPAQNLLEWLELPEDPRARVMKTLVAEAAWPAKSQSVAAWKL